MVSGGEAARLARPRLFEAQFQALRYLALDETDHASHVEQASLIRRYIRWRNRDAQDKAVRELVNRANVA